MTIAVSSLLAVMPIGIIIFSGAKKTDEEEEAVEGESHSGEDEEHEEAETIEASEVDDELESFDDDYSETAIQAADCRV